jgi:hypothetical protein
VYLQVVNQFCIASSLVIKSYVMNTYKTQVCLRPEILVVDCNQVFNPRSGCVNCNLGRYSNVVTHCPPGRPVSNCLPYVNFEVSQSQSARTIDVLNVANKIKTRFFTMNKNVNKRWL